MQPLKNDELQAGFELLSALEYQMSDWHRKLKAAQKLHQYYKNSEFAVNTIFDREQEFKKRWWDACQQYHSFKRTYGL